VLHGVDVIADGADGRDGVVKTMCPLSGVDGASYKLGKKPPFGRRELFIQTAEGSVIHIDRPPMLSYQLGGKHIIPLRAKSIQHYRLGGGVHSSTRGAEGPAVWGVGCDPEEGEGLASPIQIYMRAIWRLSKKTE
jgi:hypothetical protein